MALSKRIILDWDATGLTVYCIIRRESDGFRMDDSDGSFAASPADPYVSLTEDAVIKGRYELDEARTVWTDGLYTVAIYNQAGGSPAPASDTIIGTGPPYWAIKDDLEVFLSAPAALASVNTETRLAELDAANLPADIDALPTAAEIWTYTTRTLTSFGTLVSDIFDAITAVCALETTSQEILAQVTGTGNRVVTIHVQDSVAAPIADVLVRIGTASAYTDTSGDAVFALDDGDYDVILRKDFVTFTVPEPLTVAGDGTHPYTGAVFAPSVPTQPGTCVVYGIVIDNGNAVVEGTKIYINTVDNSTFAEEAKIVKNQSTESAADGTWQLELIRNSELAPNESYKVIMCDTSFKYETTITVPDKDSEKFSAIKGT